MAIPLRAGVKLENCLGSWSSRCSRFEWVRLSSATANYPGSSESSCSHARFFKSPLRSTHSRKLGCASHQRQTRYRDDICRKGDALGWGATGCLRHFPPSALNRRCRRVWGGAVQTSRRLPKRGGGVRFLARHAFLYRGDRRTMPPPQPRDLELREINMLTATTREDWIKQNIL